MNNLFKYYAVALGITAIPMLTSCSDNDNNNDGAPEGYSKVGEITFENSSVLLAGPDSYGANLYNEFTEGEKFTSGAIAFNHGADAIEFGLNTHGDYYEGIATLYNGGMFLSQFNLRSNPPTKTDGWWYSYENQCSVYNTDSQDGANKGAGDDGSNTFAIINGFCDENAISTSYGNGKEVSIGGFNFANNAEFLIGDIEICNTSYVYGVIQNGNNFAASLVNAKGWFKVQAYGYDAQGQMTNGGQPLEYTICDYRENGTPKNIDDDWEEWNLSQLGEVNRVIFNFVGSDISYGYLNTPGYIAIDNIEIFAPKKP